MSSGRDERLTSAGAIATVVLMLPIVAVGVGLPGPSPADATELVAYLRAHRAVLLAAIHLASLAWGGCFLVFAAGLRGILGRAEGDGGPWARVAFGGALVTAAAILVADTLLAAAVYRAPAADSAVLPVLWIAGMVANQMTAYPNAVYTIAVALVVYRTGVWPRWIAHAALAVAAVHLLSVTSVARDGAWAPWGVVPSVAPLSHTAFLAAVAFVLWRR
jgi:hypothetical protein